MKKIFTLICGVALGATSFAQSNMQIDSKSDVNAQQIFSSEEFGSVNSAAALGQSRGSATCVDTNRWAWGRSFNNGSATYFTNQMINDTNGTISGWSVYYEVPAGESIDLSGFRMFGRSIRPDGASVDLNCGVFNATSDSLPDGNPVAATTISLDTTTAGTIASFQKDVVFNSTATLSNSFVLVIELVTAGPGDSIEVLRGFTGSALNDYPFAYKVPSISTTNWLPGSAFGPNFARIPHIYPFVSFNATNQITASSLSVCDVDQVVDFSSDNAWLDNEYWTIGGFVSGDATYWSVNGGAYDGATTDTSITFADPTVDYTVSMHDSLLTWFNGNCVVTETASVDGTAEKTDAQVSSLASGTNSTDACNNGPGSETIYNMTGETTFYTDSIVSCTPPTVSAGFMSNGQTWWEFDANGVLINTDVCSGNSINEVNGIASKAFFTQGYFNVLIGTDLANVETLAIYDITGKNVMNANLTSGVGSIQQFEASELPEGIYIINAGDVSMKVVK